MNDVVDCLGKLSEALNLRGLEPGGLAHSFAQLQLAIDGKLQGFEVALEKRITGPAGFWAAAVATTFSVLVSSLHLRAALANHGRSARAVI